MREARFKRVCGPRSADAPCHLLGPALYATQSLGSSRPRREGCTSTHLAAFKGCHGMRGRCGIEVPRLARPLALMSDTLGRARALVAIGSHSLGPWTHRCTLSSPRPAWSPPPRSSPSLQSGPCTESEPTAVVNRILQQPASGENQNEESGGNGGNLLAQGRSAPSSRHRYSKRVSCTRLQFTES